MLINSVKNTAANKFFATPNSHKKNRPVFFASAGFFLLCTISLWLPLNALAKPCSSNHFDKTGIVKRVFDGDTVQLESGEKIRLIGINTPEMNYTTDRPEPYARRAKQLLSKNVLNKTVKLRLGRDKKDKYKRQLAHLYLADGTNIQAKLLQAGLAFNIAIPPNITLLDCYQTLETRAKQQKIGLWRHSHYQPIKANKVNRQTLGFRRIEGSVISFRQSKDSIWLGLSNTMALRISKKDKDHFESIMQNNWIGKNLIAQGWISQRKKKFSMRIHHQAALEIN